MRRKWMPVLFGSSLLRGEYIARYPIFHSLQFLFRHLYLLTQRVSRDNDVSQMLPKMRLYCSLKFTARAWRNALIMLSNRSDITTKEGKDE